MTALSDLKIEIDGQVVPVRLRRSSTGRSMSIRLDPRDGTVLLVLPQSTAVAQGMAFVCSKADWLRQRLEALPPARPFRDGAYIPFRGQQARLRHCPDARRGVWQADGEILVSGGIDYFERRLSDWLKSQAMAEISRQAIPMAGALTAAGKARPLGRISLRDGRSRWGSCTSRGDLSFSWRLILAPPDVLTYVVAHEVAHLAELNHSEAFWRLVVQLSPDAAQHRTWLKRHGTELHRIG